MESPVPKRPYNYRFRIIRSEAGSEIVESREKESDMRELVQQYRQRETVSLLAIFDHEAGAFEILKGDDVGFVRKKMKACFGVECCPPGNIMR